MKTKEEKLSFIINHLYNMKGLEFIDDDENLSCNYAISLLKNHIKKINKNNKVDV
jgi:hypothetical protein